MQIRLHKLNFFKRGLKYFSLLALLLAATTLTSAQCPPNIDFEFGNFTGWECWVGHTYNLGGKNAILWDVPPANVPVNPALYPNRFKMLSAFPGDGIDFFGEFPVNCPNGSGKSIKLGNTTGNHEAEGVSYTFTIPAGQNTYSLIYNYAVVFQGPVHEDYEQPRMVIEILNLTDNEIIDCSSFNFFYSNSSPTLPGFFLSTTNNTATPVWCKNWTATSIKLDGLAGKKIRLFFKSADCVFTEHFGYAYVDVNTECSSSFTGATYCPDDAFINVRAPFGYETYTWWDMSFTTVLGNSQTINFTPPPPSGTSIAVVLDPFNGFGCKDTLYAHLYDTLTLQSLAGPDKISCNNAPVQLGANSRPGLTYSWSPVTGLNDPHIANPIATTSVTTQYVITTTNAGGGCATNDTTIVTAVVMDNTLQLIGPSQFCSNDLTQTKLKVLPADSIQWYRNAVAIPGANQTEYIVTQSGTYHATLFSFSGCILSTADQVITVNPPPLPGFNVNAPEQCFANNQFIFTNNSSPAGTLQYYWDFGDGLTSIATDPVHSYALTGTYTVKLRATSGMGCKDSIAFPVTINADPAPGFTINTSEQCFKNNQFVFTNTSTIPAGTLHYNWDFGDAITSTATDPVHSYALPGTYTVKLLATSNKGCKDSVSFIVQVNAEPVAGFTVNTNEQCLLNNSFVFNNTSTLSSGNMQYRWQFGDGNTAVTKDVTYSYSIPGIYTVKLLTTSDKGCADSIVSAITVNPSPVSDFTVGGMQQCFINNLFNFINQSTISSGTLQYTWNLGDGATSTATDISYSYLQPGNYAVKLDALSDKGCPHSSTLPVTVYNYAVADFAVDPVCQNQQLPLLNKTVNNTTTTLNYLWDFGNGQTAAIANPVYSYPAEGTYIIKLSVNTNQCLQPLTVKQITVVIKPSIPGIRYPDKNALMNFPEPLQARQIGSSVLWTPATGLDNPTSFTPVFKNIYPQFYTIKLETPNGCFTTDTQMVKTSKRINIYVPQSFTPDGNGINDYLRPLLMGFGSVAYFRVYNRWGKLLFQMQSDLPGWDGRINGKIQDTQTVVWMIEAVDIDGHTHKEQGTTILIR
ncbi:MAG: PKD domain-containing protein [Ferruginibacter sp.]